MPLHALGHRCRARDPEPISGRPRPVQGVLAAILLGSLTLIACRSSEKAEAPPGPEGPTLADYGRPLPEGQSALRMVRDPARMPDLAAAWRAAQSDARLLRAIEKSIAWFDKPSTTAHFPMVGVTHEQARASLRAAADLFETARSQSEFVERFTDLFDVYESVGWNGEGIVLYTGYYSPVFDASRTRTARFTAPLYTRPADLETDPTTGRPLGRRTPTGQLVPYYTREQIDGTGMFAGSELVWVESPLDAYVIHVNGSAKLRMTDGSPMYVGYAGKTDRPYASLGRELIERGLIEEGGASLAAIRRAHERDPEAVRDAMNVNESYVFFRAYDQDAWPSGSLGFKVNPRAGLVLVDTDSATIARGPQPFVQFMLDQDTGGAIRAPGRADLYMGEGPTAGLRAGYQYAEGRLYYFFLKPRHVDSWSSPAAGPLG